METLNPFFEWLLKTSFQASLLIGLILLLQILLRSRLPVRWRYSLWLVLLIRLALPCHWGHGIDRPKNHDLGHHRNGQTHPGTPLASYRCRGRGGMMSEDRS